MTTKAVTSQKDSQAATIKKLKEENERLRKASQASKPLSLPKTTTPAKTPLPLGDLFGKLPQAPKGK